MTHNHEVVDAFAQRVSMLKSGRPFAIAAVLSLLVQAGVASAQTVIARKAPAGSTVELVLNTTKVGTATADAAGDAKLPFTLQEHDGKAEMDATVHVDVCPDIIRVIVVDRNLAPAPPDAGCTRKDVVGVFWVRRVTNLVVDTGSVNATVFLRQGPVDLTQKGPKAKWTSTPTGLIVFGGAGLGWFRDAFDNQCGNSSVCNGDDSHTTYTAGATFWLGPFLGVEGAWLKPATVNANGAGSNFRFNSDLSSYLYVINGKVGIPIGKVKLYGQGGTNYHRGKMTTTETIDDGVQTVNGLPEVVHNGQQTIELKTGGWGWQVGGGLEVWVKGPIAIFGEVSRNHLKGDSVEGLEGSLADYLNAVLVGVRFKIGH